MWGVALSLAAVGTRSATRLGQAVYSQNRDGYGVKGYGRGGGGSEVWWHVRVLYGCEAGCEVLTAHGVSVSTKINRVGAAARQ